MLRRRRRPKLLRKARGAGGVLQWEDTGAASGTRQDHGTGGPVQGGVGAAPATAAAARAPPAGKLLPGLHVEFRDVSFSYCAQSDRRHGQQRQQQQPQQLTDLTFTVSPGECIAIVGPPGTHPPAHSRPACETWAEVALVVEETPRSAAIHLHPGICTPDQAHQCLVIIYIRFNATCSLRRGAALASAQSDTNSLHHGTPHVRQGRGELLAGSGKSTLLRLMLRQHDARPGRGWVAVNGTDVRLLRRESLYAAVAAVPQQVSLVNGTIASNIAFGWCVLPSTLWPAQESVTPT